MASDLINTEEAKFIFLLKSHMLDIGGNMPYKYKSDQCICEQSKETQEHMYNCQIYINYNEDDKEKIQYRELFGNNLINQLKIARIMKQKMELRTVLLSAAAASVENNEPGLN